MQRLIKPEFLAIHGDFTLEDDTITFIGESRGRKGATKKLGEKEQPSVVLKSNIYFRDGEVNAQICLERKESKIQFRLGASDSSRVFCGINVGAAAYGIALQQTGEPMIYLSMNGQGTSISVQTWLDLKIKVRGSEIELFLKGVSVAKAQAQTPSSQLELVLMGLGKIQIRNITVSAQKPKAFVVMQFSKEYDALFSSVIKPICERFNYEVIRADNIYTNGQIIEDITSSIRESSVVIADITPNNLNVFYEVGYAHGIAKPTILLSDKSREKLPFDLAGVRTLFYDNTIGGKDVVQDSLERHLEALAS